MTTKKPAAKKVVAKKAPAKKVAKPAEKKVPAKKVAAKPKAEPKLKIKATSEKDRATKKGEPYISVVSVEIDPDNVENGAFELDWNEVFVARLVKAGYKGRDDAQIVDQWFQDVCRNVLAENFEQWEANQTGAESPRVVSRKDLGNGRSEIS